MLKTDKTAVVYRSKTGFTKNYATWLSKRLGCTLLEGDKVSGKDLVDFDTIIYGSGLYASGISGIKLITKNFEQMKNKRLIVFAVGASPNHKGIVEELVKTNIPVSQQDKIEFYYLRGGFDYSRLSPFYKVLMLLKKLQLKHVKNPDADTKGMLASYSKPLDFTNEKHLEPIIKSLLG